MKKISVLMIFVIVLISLIVPVVSYANVEFEQEEVQLLQCGQYSDLTYNVDDETVPTSSVGEKLIYEGLLNCATTIDVSSAGLDPDTFFLFYSNVVNNHPDLFYVSTSIQYTKNTIPSKVLTVTPSYALSKSEISDAKVIFNAGVTKAINQVTSDMTDLEKALVIHDYLCDLGRYPTDAANIYHSAYGIFYNGDTVCAGYTLAYSYVMNKLGVPTKHVVSGTMNHAWNIVKIDSYWYNVDLTFDDFQLYNGINEKGAVLHTCFLKSTDALKQTKAFCHSGMQYPDDKKCVSDLYDDMFWDDVTSNIAVKDHKFYYLEYQPNIGEVTMDNYTSADAKVGTVRIKTSDIYNNTEYPTEDIFTTKSNNGYTIVTNEAGTVINFPIVIPYSQLVYLNGEIYFSWYDTKAGYSNSRIYYYDIENNKCTWLRGLDYPIFGMSNNGISLTYNFNKNNTDYKVLSQKILFSNAYATQINQKGYNPYCDINNDGYINGKDYLYVRGD